LAAMIVAGPASASSYSTDQSDLWYNPNESGWGTQLVQRGPTIFATMFVYDQAGNPIWYTATLNTAGSLLWSGDLLLTNGPWFGTVPFSPGTVGYRRVGTMSWTANTVTDGTLEYSVDGVHVVKNLTRQTLVFDNYSGRYQGATHRVISGCLNPIYNGTLDRTGGVLDVQHNGTSITMQGVDTSIGAACAYTGTFSQAGQMGAVNASFACNDGSTGTARFFELQISTSGFTGRFETTYSNPPGCRGSGWTGATRATTL